MYNKIFSSTYNNVDIYYCFDICHSRQCYSMLMGFCIFWQLKIVFDKIRALANMKILAIPEEYYVLYLIGRILLRVPEHKLSTY